MADNADFDQTQQIHIKDEVIRLGQFLKLAGVVDSGFDAKAAIENGEVSVNGAVDTRRGKQLRHGDVVECVDQLSGEAVKLQVISSS